LYPFSDQCRDPALMRAKRRHAFLVFLVVRPRKWRHLAEQGNDMQIYGWSAGVTPKPPMADLGPPQAEKPAKVRRQGLIAGTRVASNIGWRKVEKLAVGDKVLTFDNGMQVIVGIDRQILFANASEVPDWESVLVFPVGALGNRDEIRLPADLGIMLESESACDQMGDPYAVVPAQALEGLCGIHRSPPTGQIELITLVFSHEEVIYIDGGLQVHCPCKTAPQPGAAFSSEALYTLLSVEDAHALLGSTDLTAQMIFQNGGYVFGTTDIGLVA
jgi:hypothetical protein